MVDVSLRQLTDLEARNVIERHRPSVGWARDFPADVDVEVAKFRHASSGGPLEPWSSPWLIVVDDVVAGMVGFKGPPKDGEIEVGYDVVPSLRGRGVAVAALGQLLELVRDRALDVRAETATWNSASQGVLRRLGFVEVGRRSSLSEGELIVWRRANVT